MEQIANLHIDPWRLTVGRLAGFKYRQIIKRLKKLVFEFDRQAAGAHELWFNRGTQRHTTIPNHPGDMLEGALRAIIKQAGITIEAFPQAH